MQDQEQEQDLRVPRPDWCKDAFSMFTSECGDVWYADYRKPGELVITCNDIDWAEHTVDLKQFVRGPNHVTRLVARLASAPLSSVVMSATERMWLAAVLAQAIEWADTYMP